MIFSFSQAETFIYVTSATIVHERVQKKDGAPLHSFFSDTLSVCPGKALR